MRKYDAIAVLGKDYDFERQRYPNHVYESLRVAARMYESGQAVGGIAVCGAAAMKALQKGMRAPTTEAEEMERYLVSELDVPSNAVYVEDKSIHTPRNFVNLKAIATERGWREIYMPIAEPRVARAAFLGQKICYGQCDFTIEGVAGPDSAEEFCTEAKLLGDAVCTLKDMPWGSDEGATNWNTLSREHHACEFYVSTDAVTQGVAERFKNFHPDELMLQHAAL
jgi:hypothetical protein